MSARARPQRLPPEECPPSVRIAKRTDEAALLNLVMDGVAKEIAVAPVNEGKVRALIQEVTKPVGDPLRPIVAVIDGPDGKPVAAAPLIPREWWYSQEIHFVQPWIYVKEEYRRQPFAKTLLETTIWWAARVGAPMFISVSASDEAAKRREMTARYADLFGGSFIHMGGMSAPTKKPPNTRVADLTDYSDIKRLCLMLNEENASAKLSEDRLEYVLYQTLRQDGGVVLLVKDDQGVTVGCACLLLDQWDYSLAWHYTEMWVFVHPAHREGGKYAIALIDFCKWWAEQTGIPVTIGITSQHRTEAKLRLYRRHLRPLDVYYFHDTRGRAENAALK